MKMKIFVFVLMMGFGCQNVWAERPDLTKIEGLIANKKYFSAFSELKSYDPDFNDPKVVSKMAFLATHYYVFCVNRMVFAFKDLSPSEYIEDVRGSNGKYEMLPFDIEKELLTLETKNPNSGEILEAIGDFYYSGICQLEQNKVSQAESYYKRAEKLVSLGYRANHNMGVIYLRKGKFVDALAYLSRGHSQNPSHGSTQYNLAYAYNAVGKPKKAVFHAENAYRLYRDKKLKSEAALMAAYMNLDAKNKAKALEYAVLANKYKHENHYHILTMLLAMYLEMGEVRLADERADELLNLDPKNSRLSEDALNSYMKFGYEKEFLGYLKRNANVHAENPMALGNLFFQKGRFYFYLKKENSKAVEAFKTSQAYFKQVVDEEHPALLAISKMLQEIEGK